jgi:hypothetical protein
MPLTFGSPHFFTEQVKRFSAPRSNSQVHVLLHSTNGNDCADPGAVECREPFALAERMWLCRLPDDLRDVVYKACEPPGEPYEFAHRQYGQLYSVALFMGPMLPGLITSWDGYGYFSKFVTYSQLVHPTSIGFGNTAVLTFSPEGEFFRATPGPCRGFTEQAFVVPDMRNWLSQSECETIKHLFNTADLEKLSDRVSRANWSVQLAAYQYFFEVRSLLVAAGLDALVHARSTRKGPGTGAQFEERTVQLASELGIAFSEGDAAAVWDHRSDVAHGRDPWASLKDASGNMPQPPTLTKSDPLVRRYLAAEQVLRSTILRCLTDPSFAKKFESDTTVETAYPVSVPRSKGRKP